MITKRVTDKINCQELANYYYTIINRLQLSRPSHSVDVLHKFVGYSGILFEISKPAKSQARASHEQAWWVPVGHMLGPTHSPGTRAN